VGRAGGEKTGRACGGACKGPEDGIARVRCRVDVLHGRLGMKNAMARF